MITILRQVRNDVKNKINESMIDKIADTIDNYRAQVATAGPIDQKKHL